MRLNFWHFAEDRLLSINRMNPEIVPLFYFVNSACAVIRHLKGRWALLERMNALNCERKKRKGPFNHFTSSVQPQGLNHRPAGLLFTISLCSFSSNPYEIPWSSFLRNLRGREYTKSVHLCYSSTHQILFFLWVFLLPSASLLYLRPPVVLAVDIGFVISNWLLPTYRAIQGDWISSDQSLFSHWRIVSSCMYSCKLKGN